MSAAERGGLKAAFANFKKSDAERDAELKLLGRTVELEDTNAPAVEQSAAGAAVATAPVAASNNTSTSSGLMPRPLLQREAVRQLSFRCPVSIAAELKRKAAFNQLEQQEIIVEGLKRVLLELIDPPEGWEG
jgi:hypothetical protein